MERRTAEFDVQVLSVYLGLGFFRVQGLGFKKLGFKDCSVVFQCLEIGVLEFCVYGCGFQDIGSRALESWFWE